MKLLLLSLILLSSFIATAETKLINGIPVGELFRGVGTFNLGCTITKIGPRQFISAAHCVRANLRDLNISFKDHNGRLKVISSHIHPSWVKDCGNNHCDGTEVGSSRMTPGRVDVVMINVAEETPKIPVINVNYQALEIGKDVAMVGAGCTRGIEPGGKGRMRYAITKLISHEALVHKHSLYKDIAAMTGESDWITPGIKVDRKNSSLCPGDSGGPLLAQNENMEWEIVGIAADYTFDGPYRDGDETVTNLHARLDDDSLHNVGAWIRSVWVE